MAELCFKVPGKSDTECVKAITVGVRKLDGVTTVEVDLHTRWVVVTGDRVDTAAIRAAVRDAGFEADL